MKYGVNVYVEVEAGNEADAVAAGIKAIFTDGRLSVDVVTPCDECDSLECASCTVTTFDMIARETTRVN